jgi:hypothetical protein
MTATVSIMLVAIVITTSVAWHGRGRCTNGGRERTGLNDALEHVLEIGDEARRG